MKKMTELKDKGYAEFENEIDSLKTMRKFWGQQLAQFQNAMYSVKNITKTENKCYTKFRDEMRSKKKKMEKSPSIHMKQAVHLPESRQSRVRMREPMNICIVATTSTADRMNDAISKVRTGLVPLPNIKAETAKVNTLRNIRHKPDGDRLKIYT
jgi:hypothetical protein